MPPRRPLTEPRDAVTTAPESPQLHRPRPTTPPPPPSARRARMAEGSAPPTAVKLRRPPVGDGLDAVVAGLLGRANSMRTRRMTRHPQLPEVDAYPGAPEGTGESDVAPDGTTSSSYPIAHAFVPPPSVRPRARWPWITLAFAAGAGIATAIALALT